MRKQKLFKSRLHKRLLGHHRTKILAPIYPTKNQNTIIMEDWEIPFIYHSGRHERNYFKAIDYLKLFLYYTDAGMSIKDLVDYVVTRTNYISIFTEVSPEGIDYVAVLRQSDNTYGLFKWDLETKAFIPEEVGNLPVLNIDTESNDKKKKKSIYQTIKTFIEGIIGTKESSV